ncbi:MAG: Rrf2 family transcriptional regulator [Gammaproteobacteria bacterium]|nr:Rrf2 family transcriptional regulator [Gammaproteobacteria bacterium]
MQLTTRGRYAVTAMLDIALHQQKGAVPLNDIAKRQGLSPAYLEQLLAKLRRQGLLTSIRGPGGGYHLKGPAETIVVAEIINAIDENIDVTLCQGKENCRSGLRCLTHSLWSGLGEVISHFLGNITLEDLMSDKVVNTITRDQIKQLTEQREQQTEHDKEEDYYG